MDKESLLIYLSGRRKTSKKDIATHFNVSMKDVSDILSKLYEDNWVYVAGGINTYGSFWGITVKGREQL